MPGVTCIVEVEAAMGQYLTLSHARFPEICDVVNFGLSSTCIWIAFSSEAQPRLFKVLNYCFLTNYNH